MSELKQGNKISLSSQQKKELFQFIERKSGLSFDSRHEDFVIKHFINIQERQKIDFETFFKEFTNNLKNQEFNQLIERITVHETMFFRDKKYFAFLKDYAIPDIINKNQSGKFINLLVAAGSSGQEALSIIFLLDEHFPNLKNWSLNIFSTDISYEITQKALKGIYDEHELSRGLTPEQRERYFYSLSPKKWKLRDEYLNKINFQVANLIENFDSSIPKFDIISCRNTFIYFNKEQKEASIKRLAKQVRHGGYLILGQVDYINKGENPVGFDYKILDGFPYFSKDK